MIIALDAMGGDFAPEAAIKGAFLAQDLLPEGVEVLLIGDQKVCLDLCEQFSEGKPFPKIVHSDSVIGMGEHPTKAFTQKQDSSIAIGFKLLATTEVDAFCSAGNTGAMLVGAMFTVKTIPGVLRPAIAGIIPTVSGKLCVILDVGANAECKVEFLNQFAEIGSLYAEYVLEIDNPKVALMNLGEEEGKGTLLTQTAYQLLKQNSKINFIGNIEGRDLLFGKSDVIVTDGFSGNILLKLAESFYDILVLRNAENDEVMSRFNYEVVGGSPIIGVNGNVMIGHGVSTPTAIKNMIFQSYKLAASNVTEKISHGLSLGTLQNG